MTAAVYAARKKIKTILVSKETGGQVVWTSSIENYMGYQYIDGIELMDKFEKQLAHFPIERCDGEEAVALVRGKTGFDITLKSGEAFQCEALIVATGKTPRRLDVPGEMQLTGRGVSYCAVCDAPVFSDMPVAVVGGGNSALEAIDDLLKIAEQVYSIAEVGFTGDGVLVDRVTLNPKLKVLPSHRVRQINGRDGVESLAVQNIKTGELTTIEVKGVFVETGLIPNSALLKGIARLNTTGEVMVDCGCNTSVPGLFAAGDVTDSPEKQIIIAAGEGAKAALQAHRYLQRLTG